MNELFINAIGYSAAVVGTTIMIPQVIKSFRTKSVGDVSIWMLILFLLNCSLWVTYGALIKDGPVLISNAIVLVIIIIQTTLKIKYK